jgi:hypothetical protein
LFLFEVSEVQEQDSAHDQSLIFFGAAGREMDREVISITDHSLQATRRLLLDTSNNITRRDLKFEINDLTALEGSLAVHTALAAASVNLVFNVVVLVVDVQNNVAACEGVSNLSEVFVLAIFDVGNGDFGSITAVEGTGAGSVNQEERLVVEFLAVVFETDLELEWSAFTTQALSGAAARLFLALEELLSFLITIFADWVNIVGVFTFTASYHFSQFQLLLDEDTVSGIESIETLFLLFGGSVLLRIAWLGLWVAGLLEAWLTIWLRLGLSIWLLLRITRLAVRLRLGLTKRLGLAILWLHGLAVLGLHGLYILWLHGLNVRLRLAVLWLHRLTVWLLLNITRLAIRLGLLLLVTGD